MKKLFCLSLSLVLALTLIAALSPASVLAATTPSIDYVGTWSDDGTTLTLNGSVNNPDNKFYSGAVALDYDPSLFTVADSDITAATDFSLIKTDVDDTGGHIRTDLAYLGKGGGLDAGSTPTPATKINLKLKNGKTKNDVKVNSDGTSDSIKISTSTDYVNSLGTSYSGGPVTIYGSKNKTDDSVTKYGTKDSTASGSVTIPTNSTNSTKNIKSIAPVSVSTTTGTKPSLPTTVKVTYDDGTTADLPVTWDDIPASKYASAGTFKVNGTVAGSALKAEATVTVTAPTSNNGSNGSNGNSTTTPSSNRTGDNVRLLTFMGILLGASIIVILIVLLTRKKNKDGE